MLGKRCAVVREGSCVTGEIALRIYVPIGVAERGVRTEYRGRGVRAVWAVRPRPERHVGAIGVGPEPEECVGIRAYCECACGVYQTCAQ